VIDRIHGSPEYSRILVARRVSLYRAPLSLRGPLRRRMHRTGVSNIPVASGAYTEGKDRYKTTGP